MQFPFKDKQFHVLLKLQVFFSYVDWQFRLAGRWTASSSAEWSLDKLPSNFVKDHEWLMWDIIWASPQQHWSESNSLTITYKLQCMPSSSAKPMQQRDSSLRDGNNWLSATASCSTDKSFNGNERKLNKRGESPTAWTFSAHRSKTVITQIPTLLFQACWVTCFEVTPIF